MLRNYLKTAIRNLLRYKGFTLINILGLAIGMTGCLVIALFVFDELKYDKFFSSHKEVYRVYSAVTKNTGEENLAVTPPMYATYLQQNYPETEATLRIMMSGNKFLFEAGEKSNYEDKGLFVDGSFFNMFPLTLTEGDASTALINPNTVVISQDMAYRYFGNASALDKIVYIDKDTFAVKGVLAALPKHFHLQFNYLMSLPSAGIAPERMQRWTWQQFYTYVKLKAGTNAAQLEDKFQKAVYNNVNPPGESDGTTYLPRLQPLQNIHLQSADFVYDNAIRGNKTYVNGLSLIALFVLVIAGFNFINLATARSFRRAREIGVRKVAGAHRGQLIGQFTLETILLAAIAVLIATIATIILVPVINEFTGKEIVFNPLANPLLAFLLLVGAVVVGALAGIYPALILSGFEPVKVLRGSKLSGSNSGHMGWLRQGLVIVQFALSALLIICTTVVYRQVTYLHNKDLGFNKEQVIFFNAQGNISENIETFKNELKRSPNVLAATAGYGLPGDQFAGDGVIIPGKNGDQRQAASLFIVDHDYIKTLGLKLVAGRDFSREITTDVEEAFIINETAVKAYEFGTPQAALGQRIHWDKWIPDSLHPMKKGRVVGVIQDYHYKSLHEKVEPAVLQIYPPVLAKVAVKIRDNDVKTTLAHINATWNKFSPAFPLDYQFMDESFGAMYASEDKLGTLLWVFTVMAIVVGCMGLFGLAAFTAEQRNKEIGIRKVLGAGVLNIVYLLSQSFLRPVFIASLVAFPVACWLMNKWLLNFPYRVQMSWWVFGISAIAAILIALLTISFQTIKAAVSNPVKSLRAAQ